MAAARPLPAPASAEPAELLRLVRALARRDAHADYDRALAEQRPGTVPAGGR